MAKIGYAFVHPFLAIGSAPPIGKRLPFDALILCAMEYQPVDDAFPDVAVLYAPFDDAVPINKEDMRIAWIAGRNAAQLVRNKMKTLVTCMAGRNRSGLVTAYALMELGCSAEIAIQRVRLARGPDALSNPFFVKLLYKREQRRVVAA